MLRYKLIPSLEKPFLDESLNDLAELKKISVLRNERLSLQLAVTDDGDPLRTSHRRFVGVKPEGVLAPYTVLRSLESVPSAMPAYPGRSDAGYLRTTPGLYPDLLSPLQMRGSVACVTGQVHSVWVEIDTHGEIPAGDYTFTLVINDGGSISRASLSVEIISAGLPEQELRVTQWFHCDCLATYYNVEIFSERHWEIIENFVRTAVKNGINMLLTPVFTPPLDTYIGGERPTVQLVGVTMTADGGWEFDFSLLDRWIDMCDRCGVGYFEISHLFTQWGAAHAPKIVAKTPDGVRRIFGWDTDATGSEYTGFIRAFLGEFLAHMRSRGDDRRCWFHISDEPNAAHLEQYLKAKETVGDLLEGYPVMDALSDYEFYKTGAVTMPIPASNHIEPFIEGGVTPLWTYYCCGQGVGVSNRFLAMPGARTRYIGVQFYKYNIFGFLQWGYNFYNNQGSYDPVNPYVDSTGNYFVPSGDAYSVYPASDGTALESMRLVQFREGIDDMRAMRLAESLVGRERVISAIEELTGEIVFSRCVCDSKKMLAIRERVNRLIADGIKAHG